MNRSAFRNSSLGKALLGLTLGMYIVLSLIAQAPVFHHHGNLHASEGKAQTAQASASHDADSKEDSRKDESSGGSCPSCQWLSLSQTGFALPSASSLYHLTEGELILAPSASPPFRSPAAPLPSRGPPVFFSA